MKKSKKFILKLGQRKKSKKFILKISIDTWKQKILHAFLWKQKILHATARNQCVRLSCSTYCSLVSYGFREVVDFRVLRFVGVGLGATLEKLFKSYTKM